MMLWWRDTGTLSAHALLTAALDDADCDDDIDPGDASRDNEVGEDPQTDMLLGSPPPTSTSPALPAVAAAAKSDRLDRPTGRRGVAEWALLSPLTSPPPRPLPLPERSNSISGSVGPGVLGVLGWTALKLEAALGITIRCSVSCAGDEGSRASALTSRAFLSRVNLMPRVRGPRRLRSSWRLFLRSAFSFRWRL